MRPRIGLLAAVGLTALAPAAPARAPALAGAGAYGSDTETRPGTLVEVRDLIAGE
jgi:hypothetical protein